MQHTPLFRLVSLASLFYKFVDYCITNKQKTKSKKSVYSSLKDVYKAGPVETLVAIIVWKMRITENPSEFMILNALPFMT